MWSRLCLLKNFIYVRNLGDSDPEELKARTDTSGEASLRGHLKAQQSVPTSTSPDWGGQETTFLIEFKPFPVV